MGEVVLIIFGVCILYDLGLPWVGLLQLEHCGINHPIP